MFTQLENKSMLSEDLLFLPTSMIAAGAFIVVTQCGKYFNDTFLFDYFDWFLFITFLNIAVSAGSFSYFRAEKNRLAQAFSTLLLTPVFVIGFMLAAAFLSEMFYGGSGYHGEYIFPFLQRSHY